MILFLDPTQFSSFQISLIDRESVLTKNIKITPHKSSAYLSAITKFLKNHKVAKPNRMILVNGPGSYTGLRVVGSIAQGLALGWNIPLLCLNSSQIPTDLTNLNSTPKTAPFTLIYASPAV